MARLVSYSKDFLNRFDRVTEKILTECAIVTVNEAQRLMTESPRSGKFYARGKRRRKRGEGLTAPAFGHGASEVRRAPQTFKELGRRLRTSLTYHRASGSGEPPAVDTGVFRNSITYDVQVTPRGYEARVGTPMKIGKWLEFGTTKMKARPFLRPALFNMMPRYADIARKHRDGGGPGPAAPAAAAKVA